MTIYVFAEHHTRAGQIYGENLSEEYIETMGGDINLWGEGTESELMDQAHKRLAKRKDTRAGGAGDSYDWKCARNVLKYLGAY